MIITLGRVASDMTNLVVCSLYPYLEFQFVDGKKLAMPGPVVMYEVRFKYTRVRMALQRYAVLVPDNPGLSWLFENAVHCEGLSKLLGNVRGTQSFGLKLWFVRPTRLLRRRRYWRTCLENDR